MGNIVSWKEHKGQRIMYVDYSGIQDEEEYLRAIDQFEHAVLNQPKGIKMPVLVNVADTILTSQITNRNKEVVKKARDAGIPDGPTALLGVTGFKMAVVQAMMFLMPYMTVAKDEQSAKDWLVEKMNAEQREHQHSQA